jgi:plastocyanin
MKNGRIATVGYLFLLTTIWQVEAGQITIKVEDNQGQPINQAVVSLTPISAKAKAEARGLPARKAQLAQRNKQFDPHIIAVQKGARVEFPNYDDIKHQVYSLSDVQPFDFMIEQGSNEQGMVFQEAGAINVGCNIHDWMLAYIFVTDTPYFGTTDENGRMTIDLPNDNTFNWHVWHPRITEDAQSSRGSLDTSTGVNTVIKMQESLLPAYDEAADLDDFDDY